MGLIDLSKFRATAVRDTEEDIKEILKSSSAKRIGEGEHDVVIIGIHEKDGVKVKMSDKFGGCVQFGIVVRNKEMEEQLLFYGVPVSLTFKQAVLEKDGYPIKKTVQDLSEMGVRTDIFRSAVLDSDAEAVNALIGLEFKLINRWDPKQLHLEYDQNMKCHFFVKGDGTKFESGEMAAPISLDRDKKGNDKFSEWVALANMNGYKLTTQMYTTVKANPEKINENINEKISKYLKIPVAKAAPAKTPSPFPVFPKKTIAPISVEDDLDIDFT